MVLPNLCTELFEPLGVPLVLDLLVKPTLGLLKLLLLCPYLLHSELVVISRHRPVIKDDVLPFDLGVHRAIDAIYLPHQHSAVFARTNHGQ